MNQFNGQRIVAVSIGPETDSLEAVKASFHGTVTEFLPFENNPELGEVVGFQQLLNRVNTDDPNQITYYCHAKGTKYEPADPQLPQIKRWTEAMHGALLDYPAMVDSSLCAGNVFCGAFKSLGTSFKDSPVNWHYAGTFFWFRNAEVFSRPHWAQIQQDRFGSEAWPGTVCGADECGHLLLEAPAKRGQLYQGGYLYGDRFWSERGNDLWRDWQAKHEPQRVYSTYSDVLNTLHFQGARQIVVSGPQRSGTTIAAKMLAHDLDLPFFSEEEFDTHDFWGFVDLMLGGDECVVQAPTMSAYLHLLPTDCNVVWMRRNLPDILKSQERIGWAKHEQQERDRYFDRSQEHAAVIKATAWNGFQRPAIGDRAFDLDYESLRGHPLWVDAQQRKGFTDYRQTQP